MEFFFESSGIVRFGKFSKKEELSNGFTPPHTKQKAFLEKAIRIAIASACLTGKRTYWGSLVLLFQIKSLYLS